MKLSVPYLSFTIAAAFLICSSETSFAQAQQTLNRQASDNFEKSDAALNRVYQQLLKKTAAEDVPELKAAQKAWLAYRDAQSSFEGNAVARGGTMRPMIVMGASKRLTDARIQELQRLLKDL